MMGTLFLEYPNLSASLEVPDRIEHECRLNFAPVLSTAPPRIVHHRFRIEIDAAGPSLTGNGGAPRVFPNTTEVLFFLEEQIERLVLGRLGAWVGLHAGAAVLADSAIVVVGHPDTGKTTTTFQMVELGLDLLCEEVTPVDPATMAVHPFPHTLSLARGYAEEFLAQYAVRRGTLSYYGADVARYAAARVRTRPATLAAILFPAFDRSFEPAIEEVPPGHVLTDLLHYCFKPSVDDERLYDSVIRIAEHCRLFRLQTSSVTSSRALLGDVIRELS